MNEVDPFNFPLRTCIFPTPIYPSQSMLTALTASLERAPWGATQLSWVTLSLRNTGGKFSFIVVLSFLFLLLLTLVLTLSFSNSAHCVGA